MASIQQRSGGYRCQVMRNGLRIGRTFPTREAAEEWGTRTELAMTAGWLPEIAKRVLKYRDDRFLLPSQLRFPVLDEGQIVATSIPYEPVCGVYLLIKAGRVIYVGQSRDVHYRIFFHRRLGFDRLTIVRCEPRELDMLEAVYISKARSEHNKNAGSTCRPNSLTS